VRRRAWAIVNSSTAGTWLARIRPVPEESIVRLNQPMRLGVPAAVALGLAMFLTTLAWEVPAARAASGPLDAQASELVRLINGARAAYGKAPLSVDVFLASKARDGAIPCPDDASATIAGRAHDFAAYGNMSHYLRLCNSSSYATSSKTMVSMLQTAWGYGSVGEIDLVNGGYGNGAFLYSVAGSKSTWMTWTYSTTGHGMMGWKTSSSHWNIIIGGYSRVGCGGWASGSTYYYDCMFAKGGPAPSGLRSPPTKSPFSNPLPATPTPKPTARPTSRTTTSQGGAQTQSGTGNGSSTPNPTLDPWAHVTAVTGSPAPLIVGSDVLGATAEPGAGTAARVQSPGGGSPPSDGASGWAGWMARVVAVIAGSGAVILAGCYLFLSLRRRRRQPAR
jgi:Cysteine-rich secretory protein family